MTISRKKYAKVVVPCIDPLNITGFANDEGDIVIKAKNINNLIPDFSKVKAETSGMDEKQRREYFQTLLNKSNNPLYGCERKLYRNEVGDWRISMNMANQTTKEVSLYPTEEQEKGLLKLLENFGDFYNIVRHMHRYYLSTYVFKKYDQNKFNEVLDNVYVIKDIKLDRNDYKEVLNVIKKKIKITNSKYSSNVYLNEFYTKFILKKKEKEYYTYIPVIDEKDKNKINIYVFKKRNNKVKIDVYYRNKVNNVRCLNKYDEIYDTIIFYNKDEDVNLINKKESKNKKKELKEKEKNNIKIELEEKDIIEKEYWSSKFRSINFSSEAEVDNITPIFLSFCSGNKLKNKEEYEKLCLKGIDIFLGKDEEKRKEKVNNNKIIRQILYGVINKYKDNDNILREYKEILRELNEYELKYNKEKFKEYNLSYLYYIGHVYAKAVKSTKNSLKVVARNEEWRCLSNKFGDKKYNFIFDLSNDDEKDKKERKYEIKNKGVVGIDLNAGERIDCFSKGYNYFIQNPLGGFSLSLEEYIKYCKVNFSIDQYNKDNTCLIDYIRYLFLCDIDLKDNITLLKGINKYNDVDIIYSSLKNNKDGKYKKEADNFEERFLKFIKEYIELENKYNQFNNNRQQNKNNKNLINYGKTFNTGNNNINNNNIQNKYDKIINEKLLEIDDINEVQIMLREFYNEYVLRSDYKETKTDLNKSYVDCYEDKIKNKIKLIKILNYKYYDELEQGIFYNYDVNNIEKKYNINKEVDLKDVKYKLKYLIEDIINNKYNNSKDIIKYIKENELNYVLKYSFYKKYNEYKGIKLNELNEKFINMMEKVYNINKQIIKNNKINVIREIIPASKETIYSIMFLEIMKLVILFKKKEKYENIINKDKRNSYYKKKENLLRITENIKRSFKYVVIENLNSKNMINEKKDKKQEQNKQRSKDRFGYKIEKYKYKFRNNLYIDDENKDNNEDKEINNNINEIRCILINPKNTSKTCHKCGHINENITMNDKSFVCEKCGEKIYNRDENAAINIRNIGLNIIKNMNLNI